MTEPEEKKIIVDEDWKTQVEREKEEAAQAPPQEAPPPEAAPQASKMPGGESYDAGDDAHDAGDRVARPVAQPCDG